MILTILQSQTLINWFNHLNNNTSVKMDAVNYMLRPFEGNINPGYQRGSNFILNKLRRYINKLTSQVFQFKIPKKLQITLLVQLKNMAGGALHSRQEQLQVQIKVLQYQKIFRLNKYKIKLMDILDCQELEMLLLLSQDL